MRTERVRERVWAAMVGLVLADSSIVTLALPDVLRVFDTTVFGVSMGPDGVQPGTGGCDCARLAARATRGSTPLGGGLVVFASASFACAVAPSIGVLIAARCPAGARRRGGDRSRNRAHRRHTRLPPPSRARVWGTAGIVGLAVGPAAGGLLTELFSWEAIFLIQLPVILAVPAVIGRFSRAVEPGPAGRIDPAPELALGLLSAGLTGALFLLVIMLIEGWRNSRSRRRRSSRWCRWPRSVRVSSHAVPVRRRGRRKWGDPDGGRPGGVRPPTRGRRRLDVVPQLLIGVGIALALPGLTEWALSVHDPDGGRAAATIAARHAGIVLGILLLTPIFIGQLTEQHRAAHDRGPPYCSTLHSPRNQARAGKGDRRPDRASRREAPGSIAGIPQRGTTCGREARVPPFANRAG